MLLGPGTIWHRTIWHRTIWYRTIWHSGQFGTGKFGTGQFGTVDNLAPDNLAPGQFGTGQFGTRTLWHQDNLKPWVEIDNLLQKSYELLILISYCTMNIPFWFNFCFPETPLKVAVYWFCNLNCTLENCGTQKPKLSETAPCLDCVRARTLHSTGLVCKLNFPNLLAGKMVIKSEYSSHFKELVDSIRGKVRDQRDHQTPPN